MSHKTTDSVEAMIFSFQQSYKFQFPGSTSEELFYWNGVQEELRKSPRKLGGPLAYLHKHKLVICMDPQK